MFISENKSLYPVEKMCTCMQVSKNAYYHWMRGKDQTKPAPPKVRLKARIKEIFEQNHHIYGSYRIQKQLAKEGRYYSRSYVGVLMREMGLRSVLKKKFVVTTDSKHSYPVAKNVVNRDFNSLELGQKWVSDITYVGVGERWNYLTTILDLADRKVVGWSLSEDMTAENTVYTAWLAARNCRSIKEDFIFHSDRGVQYASDKIKRLFSFNRKITMSMSRKGDCWDNAVAESFFKTIKYEWLNRFRFQNYIEAYRSIEKYILWYNYQRLHSAIGYQTPYEKEKQLLKTTKTTA